MQSVEDLIGSRIRELRTSKGLGQAELARLVGISASYLNLIEHNRRSIGGALLKRITGALGVEPRTFLQGADTELVAALADNAKRCGLSKETAQQAPEFARRFPEWARALVRAQNENARLQNQLATLSDRLNQDPEVASAAHEVLSTAAAIRSSATILNADTDLDPVWRTRFNQNIASDSLRLSNSSKDLVRLLYRGTASSMVPEAPHEQVDDFLSAHRYFFEGLETGNDVVGDIVANSVSLASDKARERAERLLEQVNCDIAKLPLAELKESIREHGDDPVALMQHHNIDLALVMRRLAAMQDTKLGLVLYESNLGLSVIRAGLADLNRNIFSDRLLRLIGRALVNPGEILTECLLQDDDPSSAYHMIAYGAPIMSSRIGTEPNWQVTALIRKARSFDKTDTARA